MKTLESWKERDLTADARAGKLDPAFEIDETVGEIAGMLEAGHCPIVTGDSGVGRTAAVHELVRRVSSGCGPPCLNRRQIVEVSLMRKASTLENRCDLREHLQQLVETLRKSGRKVALFIRDIHLAYEFDLEPQLLSLALAFDGPVIGEGPRTAVDRLLEYEQNLQQHYVCVQMEEPDLDRASRILTDWANDAKTRCGPLYTPEALDQALTLTHRFLARGRLPRKALDMLRHGGSLSESWRRSPSASAFGADASCSSSTNRSWRGARVGVTTRRMVRACSGVPSSGTWPRCSPKRS